MKFGIAVILLFNLEIRTVYINHKAMVQVRGGVSDLNFWDKSITIEEGNLRKISALMNMATMDGPVIRDKPAITIADDECPSEFAAETCSSFSFLQGWTRHGQKGLEANSINSNYITLRHAPFYKLYIGQFYNREDLWDFNTSNQCRSYMTAAPLAGLADFHGNWIVCARIDHGRNALVFGTILTSLP